MHTTSGHGEVGSTFDIKVSSRPRPARWSCRVTERVEGERLRAEFTDGDFLGEGIWTFEEIAGQTRVRYRFHVRPHGIAMRLSSSIMDIPRRHSAVMRKGFEALHGYLERPQTRPPAAAARTSASA